MTPSSDSNQDTASHMEPVEQQRDKQTKQDRIGTIIEAGRDTQFIFSSANTVHKRPPLKNGDGFALTPVCGQTLPRDSVWGGINADTAEAVATDYGMTSFCSKCFNQSLRLSRLGREAREESRHI